MGHKGEVAASSEKWGDVAPALQTISWTKACSALAQDLRPTVVLGNPGQSGKTIVEKIDLLNEQFSKLTQVHTLPEYIQ